MRGGGLGQRARPKAGRQGRRAWDPPLEERQPFWRFHGLESVQQHGGVRGAHRAALLRRAGVGVGDERGERRRRQLGPAAPRQGWGRGLGVLRQGAAAGRMADAARSGRLTKHPSVAQRGLT